MVKRWQRLVFEHELDLVLCGFMQARGYLGGYCIFLPTYLNMFLFVY